MTASTPVPPPVGAFGLSRIGGALGAAIAVGQTILGDASRFTHAFVVVDGGSVVQAMPSGAELAPLDHYLGRPDVRWSDAPVQAACLAWCAEEDDRRRARNQPLVTEAEVDAFERNLRAALSAEARGLIGTPYSFVDYLALALAHLGARPKLLRRYIASSGHMICSQLVDAVYLRQGIHLFDDGRLSQDVTPGDLDGYRVECLEDLADRA